ncbi:MAG: penicillin-binding protein 1B [Gammaproteobacteria bacterium]|nr:penicillin-binding protein 1B [Gammaproteobacteria bacterium]
MPSKKPKSPVSTKKKTRASKTVKTKKRKAKSPKSKARRSSRKRKSKSAKKSVYKRIAYTSLVVLSLVFVVYMSYLDRRITERFEGRIWQLPAHVYARPLELFVGKPISVEQLKFELDYLNYQKVDQLPKQHAQYRQWRNTFDIKTRKFVFWDGNEPVHTIRVVIEDKKVSDLIDISKNENTGLVRFDAGYLTGIFPSHAQDRVLLKLDDVPDMFIKMLLLIEDRRFFSHWGVDPRSIARALAANLSSGRTVQGGSTLTQQLVKNLFLDQGKRLTRKINEAFMSLLLEFHYDKRLILETYLNEIYLGQDGRRAIHGFGLASEFYFGKSLNELSIDEMAIMIGMVKGASYYNPLRNPEHALRRRNIVLSAMKLSELITEQQAELLSKKPIVTVKHARSGLYPAFIDVVKLQLQQDYQPEDLRSEGLRVFTTLDPYVQFKTEQAVKNTLPRLSKSNELQAAAVVASPLNGDVLAVVGDRNPTYKGFNRAINASRQVGSLIKPVVYLTAFEQGLGYTLATMLDDSEFIYKDSHQDDWQPLNYDKKYHGDVTLYESLLKSHNIPAVRTALDVGLDKVIKTLTALGSKQNIPPYPSLALGAVNMSPMEMTSIYQSFSTNGFRSPLRSVFAVLDKNRQPLERYSLDVDNQVKPESVALVNSALIDVTKYGTAKYLSKSLDIQVAGKTGTSDDLKDSWFAGFSGDIVAVVWIGFDDNRSTYLTGSSGAMKIWSNLMKDVAYKPYMLPEIPGLEKYWIDGDNGLLTEQDCKNALELTFIEGTQPDRSSDCESGRSSNWFFNLFN